MKFLESAKKITSVVMLVTGLVVAIGAALQAFTAEMEKHYPSQPDKAKDNGGN